MRVITGKARGARLEAPEGREVRPTTERAKEALFSALQFELEGAHILDLFSGSGQLGIEALSRGALDCVFVDSSRAAIAVVSRNVQKTGFARNVNVINSDALDFLSRKGKKYDIIFADPPYYKDIPQKLLAVAGDALNPRGVIAVEAEKKLALEPDYGPLHLSKSYTHGAATIWIYRKEDDE